MILSPTPNNGIHDSKLAMVEASLQPTIFIIPKITQLDTKSTDQ